MLARSVWLSSQLIRARPPSRTRYAYDLDDRLTGATDPVGRVTTFGYDTLGRPAQVSNSAIQSAPLVQRAYTPDGLTASLTIARDNATFNVTNLTYDGLDRLATTTYPDSSTETLGYDADGNVLTRQTRASQTITFTYDTLNRLATKAAPSEPSVTYAYDLAGRLISASDTSAVVTALASPSGTLGTASMAYDQRNRPLSFTFGPAPAQTTPTAGSSAFTYAYDLTNRRIGQTATDNSWWSYPTTASTVSYTVNNLDQYSAIGAVTPTYDGNGNLTYDGTFTYGYDAESRLVSVVQGGTTVATYTYDTLGRRKSKTVGSTTTIYVNSLGNRAVLDYDGTSGTVQRWYAVGISPSSAETAVAGTGFETSPNNVLSQINVAANTRTTFIPDIQGSVIGSLDSSSGAITQAGYQTYGESGSISGTFRYTGARIDAETNGLYDFRARIYSPTLGRFLQVDPIGIRGGRNLYAYVNNDPLNNIDPTGLLTLQIGIAGSGSLLGFLVPQGGFGIVIDTQGNIGTYSFVGGGVGLGGSGSVGASIQFSNATTIYDLANGFSNSSLQGGGGLGGSVDYFAGFGENGAPVTGGGITFGAGIGASGSVTMTTTQICGWDRCVGPLSSPASASPVAPAATEEVTPIQPESMPNTVGDLSTQPNVLPNVPSTAGQISPK